MAQTQWDIYAAALTVWREARGEGPAGMRAVAYVIHNRAKAQNCGYALICFARLQFSSMTAAGDPELVIWPLPGDPQFEQCVTLSQQIALEREPLGDPTNGATLYCNPANIEKGGWFERNVIDNPNAHPVKAQVGKQVFYA